MNTLDDLLDNAASPSQPTRRVLLVGLLSAYTASLIPWALAQPVANAELGSFVAVSSLLAGRQALDTVLATRLYDALKADDPGFPAGAQALLTLINERKIDLMQLQQLLDSEQSPLATLPRRIVTAWYMGIVGSGDKARCLAYEHALNAAVVEDRLKPPTYSYGVYASWEQKPT